MCNHCARLHDPCSHLHLSNRNPFRILDKGSLAEYLTEEGDENCDEGQFDSLCECRTEERGGRGWQVATICDISSITRLRTCESKPDAREDG